MLLDFSQIPVEPVANMRGGEGTVLLQKTTQGPVKVMRGVLPPGPPSACIPTRPTVR